jgi:hypothetical protein
MLARALGIELPWPVHGRPALDGRDQPQVRIEGAVYDVSALATRRNAALAAQIDAFGAGEGWARVYAIGAQRLLAGRRVSALPSAEEGGLAAEIEGQDKLAFVDPTSGFVPAWITGRLVGKAARERLHLAIAVNGRIAGVTRSYRERGGIRFAVLVPESSFRVGSNAVEILGVRESGGRTALASLGRTARAGSYLLERDGSGELIRIADGRAARVVPGAVGGYVDVAEIRSGRAVFGGWAADVERRRIRDRIVVFADGEFLLAVEAPLEGGRSDLGRGLEDAGFRFELPSDVVGGREIRIFGVVGDAASELAYPEGYRWGPRG